MAKHVVSLKGEVHPCMDGTFFFTMEVREFNTKLLVNKPFQSPYFREKGICVRGLDMAMVDAEKGLTAEVVEVVKVGNE